MHIGWPQIIFLALVFMEVGVVAAKDGQPRDNFSFGYTSVGNAIILTLLYWGGFFG